ncbi:MAG: hypothetical protein FIB02_03250, partial [Desulfuromonas sp.]|nr:hypothetical protein [Desulfuromonas sp.]
MKTWRSLFVLMVTLAPSFALPGGVRVLPLTREPARHSATVTPRVLTARQQALFSRLREARRRVGAAVAAGEGRRAAALAGPASGKRRSVQSNSDGLPVAFPASGVEIHMGNGAVPRLLRSAARAGGRRQSLQKAVPVLAL